MMLDEQMALLMNRITRTKFFTVTVPATANVQGVPIGDGKCVAVVLYLNSLVLNTQANASTAANLAQVYYGDQQSQFRELIRGQQSDIIFAKDLSEIYVRGNGIENHVQVIAYMSDDNEN